MIPLSSSVLSVLVKVARLLIVGVVVPTALLCMSLSVAMTTISRMAAFVLQWSNNAAFWKGKGRLGLGVIVIVVIDVVGVEVESDDIKRGVVIVP